MIELLDEPGLSDGAAPTFSRILGRIAEARVRVEIHMYVWRNDGIGNEIGRAILDAADRGVEVLIFKDAGALMYERIEMNRKSFFPGELSISTRVKYALVGRTFPDTFVEDDRDGELGAAVAAHPKVEIRKVEHTHSKYYAIDDVCLITGSINIEDRHSGYRDYMVEIRGEELLRRFRERLGGDAGVDLSRPIEYLVNAPGRFEIKPVFLDLFATARERIYIEMAYIGDPEISEAIVAASRRGVEVTVLFSRAANIGNDINYHTLVGIWKRCELRVLLSEQMIHSKLIMVDGQTVVMGSANLSVFSMEKAVELDVIVRGEQRFLDGVKRAMEHRVGEGELVERWEDLPRYSQALATLQQWHQKVVG